MNILTEKKEILLEHDGPNAFYINWFNPYTGKPESYVFPAYRRGSRRSRRLAVSEECYYHLKDESTAFEEGYLRVVTEDVPEEVKEIQNEAQQEVVDTTPEYLENALTRDEIEKIMKGTKNTISKRLGKIENPSQKQFVVETIKELEIKNIDKLREVVKVLFGDEMEVDYIFPPTE